MRRHPGGLGGANGGRVALLLLNHHRVQPHPDLLHRAVPDVRAQLGGGAGAAGAGAGRRGGTHARRARPRAELLVLRRVRALHRMPGALRRLPPGDQGAEHVGHHGGGGAQGGCRRGLHRRNRHHRHQG